MNEGHHFLPFVLVTQVLIVVTHLFLLSVVTHSFVLCAIITLLSRAVHTSTLHHLCPLFWFLWPLLFYRHGQYSFRALSDGNGQDASSRFWLSSKTRISQLILIQVRIMLGIILFPYLLNEAWYTTLGYQGHCGTSPAGSYMPRAPSKLN